MKKLHFIKYRAMNSWNKSTAPAFNLKVYNVIPQELQSKVYELMECENFFDEINLLIEEFGAENNYEWQAGFNRHSDGYLVLHKGGIKEKHTYTYFGKSIEFSEVPKEVLNRFKQLAQDIVNYTIDVAKNGKVEEEEYTVTKTRKVLIY